MQTCNRQLSILSLNDFKYFPDFIQVDARDGHQQLPTHTIGFDLTLKALFVKEICN